VGSRRPIPTSTLPASVILSGEVEGTPTLPALWQPPQGILTLIDEGTGQAVPGWYGRGFAQLLVRERGALVNDQRSIVDCADLTVHSAGPDWHQTCPTQRDVTATEARRQSADKTPELPLKEITMSVSGISSTNLFAYSTQNIQNTLQKFQPKFLQEFQQLGQDLQSGNLSAAQADFATLQQLGPQTNSTSPSHSSNPIAQEFNQLAQDLQSGNLSAAQKDYTTIQQDFQTTAGHGHHHHHHGGGITANPISQLMAQLGQALQSGNLSSAQQAYSSLLQDSQPFTQSNGLSPSSSPSSSNSISVNA
jgi:hypothetical protein